MTVLVEVEGILNSKPFGYSSPDLVDPKPVMLNVLLMGRHDASLPQAVHGSSELLGRHLWRYNHVLCQVECRQKWRTPTADLAAHQVVMVVDPQFPRALWSTGKVTKVHSSDDGTVRSADINIKGTAYNRLVTRLVSLPKMPVDTDVRIPSPQQELVLFQHI